ncbi:MAG: PLDc N-terminal domain-containing protein, partial [Chloroflexi bacterium]|nr:PLDc N-terminal domain-containing protein [Chloroflexota bacterium]
MVDAVFLSTFWNVIGAAFLIMFVFVPLILLWTFALVDLFVRRDIQWKKVLWLLFIVFLPIFGPLIYL